MSELKLPQVFWAKVLGTLDHKIKSICEAGGYGRISVEFVVRSGVLKDVVWKDEITQRETIK